MKKIIFTTLCCLIFCVLTNAQTETTNNNSTDTQASTKIAKRKGVFRATKEQITQVQTMLNEKGTYSGDINGKFSKDFRTSIKGFQVSSKLKKTGTLNRATLEKMGITLTNKQKTYPVNPNSYDTSNNDKPEKPKKNRARSFRPTKKQITAAQTKLKNDGKFSGEITGKYSKGFRVNLKEYQTTNELKKSGKLDRPTLNRMGIPLTKRQMGIDSSGKPKRRNFRATKNQVMSVQKMLRDKGSYKGDVTGKYSKGFRNAIKDFQSANGLKRKGSLNRATLEKMGVALTDKQQDLPVNPKDFASSKRSKSGKPRKAIFRANKEQISQVQKMLKKKDLYNGEETGKLNPATRSAVREWQAQNNVKKTGTLNKVTLEAMRIQLTDKQKAY